MTLLQPLATSFPVVRHAFGRLLAGLGAVAIALAVAWPQNAAAAGNTQFFLFNLVPAGSYSVTQNGNEIASGTAVPSGAMGFSANTASGDQIRITLTGVEPVDATSPSGFQATGSDDGCVRASWNTPSAAEFVSSYSLLWGPTEGNYVDSVTIDVLSVAHSGGRSSVTRCGFATGSYYFALRAHNQFDRWSGVSNAAAVTISNGNAQGPPAPQNLRVLESEYGCVVATWDAVGDPSVTGYRLYYSTVSVAGGGATNYSDSLSVSSNETEVCDLSTGTYYFAVRSITATGLRSGFSAEKKLDVVGIDAEAPVVINPSPAQGATDVARNAVLSFFAHDEKTGVDPTTIEVNVNGAPCPDVQSFGGPQSFYVQCTMPGDLPANATITVEVSMSDRATPPNSTTTSWSFQTGGEVIVDADPPTIEATNPLADADNVPASSAIEITVSDDGLGIDVGTVVLAVNDVVVAYELAGNASAITLTYRPPTPWPAGARVDVSVQACDRANPGNCADEFTYSFTVTSTTLSALGAGAIVPDGFWADEPTRPLEIRNLPLDWTIRIFDAAGTQVRRFRNTAADGLNWIWDFTNDSGQRVARALYLVRVTDNEGKVRQSGRFLVQIDP